MKKLIDFAIMILEKLRGKEFLERPLASRLMAFSNAIHRVM
jgi:hypothetical protein